MVIARAITNFVIATLTKVDRGHGKFRKEKQQIGLHKKGFRECLSPIATMEVINSVCLTSKHKEK